MTTTDPIVEEPDAPAMGSVPPIADYAFLSDCHTGGAGRAGRLGRLARDLMERVLRTVSKLGLYAEEYDTTTARHLGSFPQAFSHLALIDAAGRIILSEMTADL